MTRIAIDPVTRIEGESRISLNVDDEGRVRDAQFSVKMFRGFEKFLIGAPIESLPQLTARICGICYTPHILVSCKAIENALGIQISPQAIRLRELLHLGNLIESHALSVAVLSFPDFVTPALKPEERNIAFLLQNSDLARRAMRVRQLGSMITKLAGKRPIHPVTPVIGGLLQPLTPDIRNELKNMLPGASETIDELWQTIWDSFRNNADILKTGSVESAFLAVEGKAGVEFYDGDLAIMNKQGRLIQRFAPTQYLDFVTEEDRDFSYMKFPVMKNGTSFRVGPLARINICGKFTTPRAQKLLDSLFAEYARPAQDSMLYHLARIAELMYAVEKVEELLNDDALLSDQVKPGIYHARVGRGVGVVEAPRGTLVHIYDIDAAGYLQGIRLYVATQHNNFAINEALTETARRTINPADVQETAMNRLEMIVRAYDPCLSCATH